MTEVPNLLAVQTGVVKKQKRSFERCFRANTERHEKLEVRKKIFLLV